MDDTRKGKVMLFGVVAALVLVVVGLFTVHNLINKKEQVRLVYSTWDAYGVTVKFNGKAEKSAANNSPTLYNLSAGTYKVEVTRLGFKDFRTSFELKSGHPVSINVQSQLVSDSTISSVDQISLPGVAVADYQITKLQYFYGRTWAILTIQAPDTDPGVIVVQYSPGQLRWKTVLGPGTLFSPGEAKRLPAPVQAYMTANGLVNPGGV